MTEDDLIMSPLCQSVSSEGKTVQVNIFSGERGEWVLEVVDQFDNSTVWDDPFPSDVAALDEVWSTINNEGIGSLIGPAPAAHR